MKLKDLSLFVPYNLYPIEGAKWRVSPSLMASLSEGE